MTSQLEQLAAQVRELANPAADLRAGLRTSLQVARDGMQAAAADGNEGRRLAACFWQAQEALRAADRSSLTFGRDAQAFSEALVGGAAARADFRRVHARNAGLLEFGWILTKSTAVAAVPLILSKGAEFGAKVLGFEMEEAVGHAVDQVLSSGSPLLPPRVYRAEVEDWLKQARSRAGTPKR